MEATDELEDYTHRGTRALILLHERALHDFSSTWREVDAAGIEPLASDDPAYASRATLLRHVLGAAAGYMIWICETLELPDPGIRAIPAPAAIASEADDYVRHLLERWRSPLSGLTEQDCDQAEARSRWGVTYCVDAMLEHAVMHPIRHEFQLRAWLDRGAAG